MNKEVNLKKISRFKTPEESPGYLLWRVSTLWRGTIEAVLKPLNLTHPQFVVLVSLGWLTREGDKVSQADVGKAAGLDPNTTSQILRGLEAKKLIIRKRSVDERSKNPEVTPTGARILKKAFLTVDDANKQFFEPLTKKEIQNLLQSFLKLLG